MGKDKFEPFDFVDFNSDRNHALENSAIVDALRIIHLYRRWFILSAVAFLITGILYVRSTPKTYLRTATILVKDEKKGGNLAESTAFQDLFSFGVNSVDNEMGFFKSKRLMQRVVEDLHLDISYKERSKLRKKELYSSAPFVVRFVENKPEQRFEFTAMPLNESDIELSDFTPENTGGKNLIVQYGDTVNNAMGKFIIVPVCLEQIHSYIDKPIHIIKESIKAVSDRYNKKLKVEVASKQSSLINLSIEDENAQRAEDILNTLIEVYKQDAIEDKNIVVINTAKFIKDRLSIIEKDLEDIDAQIEKYKKTNKLTDVVSESNMFLQRSNRLASEGLSVENQLNMAEYMKSYLRNNSKNKDMIPASIGISDNGIQSQIAEYNSVMNRRNKLLANSSMSNPIVQDLNRTLEDIRLSILRAIDNLIAGLKIQSINMKNEEGVNRSRIADVPSQQKHIISIERQQKIKEELYLYLLNKKEENELQLSITESNCRIVDSANGPMSPVSPKKAQVVLVCLILGFLTPSLWLYLRSLLNTNVHTKSEIKANITIPFLGEIPLYKSKSEKNVIIRKDSHEAACEAFRIIRENLGFMNTEMESAGKVIQMISFNPSSGKTFITTNLAMSMALSDMKVVIIDLDLRKGTLTKRSGIGTRRKGISGYLSGKIDNIEECIYSYGEESKVDIITSGALPPNPAELLKSVKLDELIETLKTTYDYILLDNPPYGIVVDAFVCTRLANQSIYVIRSGLFDKQQFPELQELYDSDRLKNMSIILNAVDYQKAGYGYDYSYAYKYGYHYKDDDTQSKPFYKRIIRKLSNVFIQPKKETYKQ